MKAMNNNPMIRRSRYAGDSNLELVPEIKLRGGAGLYRFKTYGKDGTYEERSAIYDGDYEMMWHTREKEQGMIESWNSMPD